MRPCRLRYISNAEAERSTAAHWIASKGVPTSSAERSRRKYFTSRMREVLSARSSMRPRREKCHASPLRHRGVGDAVEQVAGLPDGCRKKSCGFVQAAGRLRGGFDDQVKPVQLQPHLRGDDLADAAGVFPRGTQAGKNRVRVLAVEREELDDVFLRGCLVALG